MKLTRRHFLRGLGLGLSLPMLEAMGPGWAKAAAAASAGGAGVGSSGRPVRMAFLYVPNGVHVGRWKPQGSGSEYVMSPTLEPLKAFRDSFQVFSGFEHRHGPANGDGGGDHARASATMLTGARPKKTAGSDLRLGISVDQLAAQRVGGNTRLSSLELSCDGPRKSGSCDSGYSCAYQFNISWRSETVPVAPEVNPRLVFERLFGRGTGGERQRSYEMRRAQQRSILDFVSEDARALRAQLGRNDQRKIEEYLTGVRELERRIENAERFGALPDPRRAAPEGIPADYREHIRLMMDLLVLAFQTDSTRIATFLLAHDGSNRNFPEIGVTDGHHHLSHHQDKPETLEKIGRIDLFYVEQLAYLLQRMKETQDGPEGGASLLDQVMVMYGSGLSDGNRHAHQDLPVLLAGRGGGVLKAGRHVELGGAVPLTNLYVRMLEVMGVGVDRFGDSTGVWRDV